MEIFTYQGFGVYYERRNHEITNSESINSGRD